MQITVCGQTKSECSKDLPSYSKIMPSTHWKSYRESWKSPSNISKRCQESSMRSPKLVKGHTDENATNDEDTDETNDDAADDAEADGRDDDGNDGRWNGRRHATWHGRYDGHV